MAPKDDFDLTPAERERIRTIELFLDSEPEERPGGSVRMRISNPWGLSLIAAAMLLMAGMSWAADHFQWKRGQGPWWAMLVMLMAPVLIVLGVVLGFRGNRRGRWRAMRAAGYPICIGCGYRLDRRAPDSDRCPECGRQDSQQCVRGWPPTAAREPVEADPQESPP
jgi:hypothetical protein